MQVKFKLLNENAKLPSYAKSGDAGLDLTAISSEKDPYGNFVYGTGVSVEIPEGYVGLIFPRSSISKYDLTLSNSVGVIDSGYRGEIAFKFASTKDLSRFRNVYQVGDKVGQLVIIPYPKIEAVEVKELNASERGTGGFGSSGR